jgi:hypothetical protein
MRADSDLEKPKPVRENRPDEGRELFERRNDRGEADEIAQPSLQPRRRKIVVGPILQPEVKKLEQVPDKNRKI